MDSGASETVAHLLYHPHRQTRIPPSRLFWRPEWSVSGYSDAILMVCQTLTENMAGRQTTLTNTEQKFENPEWLHELYHGRGLTINEIAERFDVSDSTVYRRLEKYGIGRRSWPNSKYVPTRVDKEGYVRWRHQYRDDSDAKKEDCVSVHRLLAVAMFGSEVFDKKIVVHHLNGIPWDNRESNVSLMTRKGHSTHHNK